MVLAIVLVRKSGSVHIHWALTVMLLPSECVQESSLVTMTTHLKLPNSLRRSRGTTISRTSVWGGGESENKEGEDET